LISIMSSIVSIESSIILSVEVVLHVVISRFVVHVVNVAKVRIDIIVVVYLSKQ
jgi:hypothetical protein